VLLHEDPAESANIRTMQTGVGQTQTLSSVAPTSTDHRLGPGFRTIKRERFNNHRFSPRQTSFTCVPSVPLCLLTSVVIVLRIGAGS